MDRATRYRLAALAARINTEAATAMLPPAPPPAPMPPRPAEWVAPKPPPDVAARIAAEMRQAVPGRHTPMPVSAWADDATFLASYDAGPGVVETPAARAAYEEWAAPLREEWDAARAASQEAAREWQRRVDAAADAHEAAIAAWRASLAGLARLIVEARRIAGGWAEWGSVEEALPLAGLTIDQAEAALPPLPE